MGLPWQSTGQDSALSLQELWVQFLVRELRSHIQHDTTKKFKKKLIKNDFLTINGRK